MGEEMQPEWMTDSLGTLHNDEQSLQCHCQFPATIREFGQWQWPSWAMAILSSSNITLHNWGGTVT